LEIQIIRALSDLLLPPGILILMLWAGIAALSRYPRAGQWLVGLATLALTLFSLPIVSDVLCRGLEVYPPLSQGNLGQGAGAIVVLAGGWARTAEYGGWTVNHFTLERLRYGAWLHRRTGLPLLLTGGTGDKSGPTEAELMRDALDQDFGLRAQWVETHSRNTAQNARNAAAILRQEGIRRVYLVTHALHLARALPQFEAQGLEVIEGLCHRRGSGRSMREQSKPDAPCTTRGREEIAARSAWLARY
jgi:uncharacterized SAM-binding protein YcdF (DUF218 family)